MSAFYICRPNQRNQSNRGGKRQERGVARAERRARTPKMKNYWHASFLAIETDCASFPVDVLGAQARYIALTTPKMPAQFVKFSASGFFSRSIMA
jgi:hypothetical protein